jgi:hypothetical protein
MAQGKGFAGGDQRNPSGTRIKTLPLFRKSNVESYTREQTLPFFVGRAHIDSDLSFACPLKAGMMPSGTSRNAQKNYYTDLCNCFRLLVG